MEEIMRLEGPVLKINGELVLMIPLWARGDELQECSRGISEVQGEFLKIVIPEWLAGLLRIEEGDLVCVEDADGKFHITPSHPRASALIRCNRRRTSARTVQQFCST